MLPLTLIHVLPVDAIGQQDCPHAYATCDRRGEENQIWLLSQPRRKNKDFACFSPPTRTPLSRTGYRFAYVLTGALLASFLRRSSAAGEGALEQEEAAHGGAYK